MPKPGAAPKPLKEPPLQTWREKIDDRLEVDSRREIPDEYPSRARQEILRNRVAAQRAARRRFVVQMSDPAFAAAAAGAGALAAAKAYADAGDAAVSIAFAAADSATLTSANSYTNAGIAALVTVYQPLNAKLTSISGLTITAGKALIGNGADSFATFDLSTAALTVLDDASVADMVDTLGGAASTGTGGLVRKANPTLDGATLADGTNVVLDTVTGSQIGTSSTQKLGFYGASPITRSPAIPDASGGSVVDAEARSALNTLLAWARSIGFVTP
jgi:hypothetical protein